jgi:O-antigen ligase
MLSALKVARDPSISVRLDLWQVAWQFFLDNPIRGIGLGQFVATATGFTHHIEPKIAHNMFLEILTELGVPGLMIFVSIIGVALHNFRIAALKFQQSGEQLISTIAWGWLFSLIGFVIAGFFLSNQYYVVLWFYLAMGEVLKRLSM